MGPVYAKLIRHRIRPLLLFLIFSLSMIIWLLAGQTYLQALHSSRILDLHSITLALPQSPWQIETEEGKAILRKRAPEPEKMEIALASSAIKSIHRGRTFAGRSESVLPLVPQTLKDQFSASGNYLHAENCAAFSIRIQDIQRLNGSVGKIIQGEVILVHTDYYILNAEVIETLSLNTGYAIPASLEIHGSLVNQDGSLPFQAGNTYWVSGLYEPAQPSMTVHGISKEGIDYNFQNPSNVSGILRLQLDGYQPIESIHRDEQGNWRLLQSQQEDIPLFTKPDDRRFSHILDVIRFNQQLLWVAGVDQLQAVPLFANGDAALRNGRDFSENEIKNGSPVCIISTSLAQANHLSLGDILPLSLYETNFFENASLQGSHYAMQQIFPLPAPAASRPYTIIGIYQGLEWTEIRHAFSPNTIFLPNPSLPDGGMEELAFSYSILLQNGMQDQFLMDAEAAGLSPDTFTILEDGYSAYKNILTAMEKDSALAWIAAGFVHGILSISAVFLFLLNLRRDAEIMIQLGAKKSQVRRFILLCLIPPVFLAFICAHIICCALYPLLLDAISAWYTISAPLFSNLKDTTQLFENDILPKPSLLLEFAALLPGIFTVFILIRRSPGGTRQ